MKSLHGGTKLLKLIFSAYTKVIALVILICAGLYTLFFTPYGVVENFTTLAWANSRFEAGAIVLGLYQVFLLCIFIMTN